VDILHGRSAVVSCHVERPLDDETWGRFSRLQERRPGGFAIAALMRPPADGEASDRWLERAREAAARGPLGLHTHWTSATHARPTGGEPAACVREQAAWLRAEGLQVGFFCGGGWYMDEAVAEAVAEMGYADCTGTAFPPSYLEKGAARLDAVEPVWLELPAGRRLLELPTTHSIGMLARGALGRLRVPVVHAYFHDTDLLEPRRRAALRLGLGILSRRRRPIDLAQLAAAASTASSRAFPS